MFSNLMDKVLGRSKDEAEEPKDAVETGSKTADAEVAETGAKTPDVAVETDAKSGEAAARTAAPAITVVDVEANLNELAEKSAEKLDWKVSIVDLLKLLDLDSSYGTRKEMALELGYSEGDIDSKGSAEMNIWLHKTVLQKIADNGGKLPDDLLS